MSKDEQIKELTTKIEQLKKQIEKDDRTFLEILEHIEYRQEDLGWYSKELEIIKEKILRR